MSASGTTMFMTFAATVTALAAMIAIVVTISITVSVEAVSTPPMAIAPAPPRADANEDSVVEKIRSVKTVRRTFVWVVIEIPVLANWGNADFNANCWTTDNDTDLRGGKGGQHQEQEH